MGSGTTAIAAESCGRSWIGFEISQDYCKMANERIEAARRQTVAHGAESLRPVSTVLHEKAV